MSLIGLVHLAEKLFNSTQGNPNDETSPASRSAKNANAQGSNRTQSDEFRPSSGSNSTEAGLFQVKQQSVFTAAATEILLLDGGAAPNGATATTTQAPSAAGNSANAPSAAGSGTKGGFSIQELSIKFAGINETVQQGGNTLQISVFQLQVSEVNLTLNNVATGQIAQIQARKRQELRQPPHHWQNRQRRKTEELPEKSGGVKPPLQTSTRRFGTGMTPSAP